ncbi:MAG: putative Efflux transporter, permease protein [Candidatus Saccharibacteria bacterium]|nr:putative Efflux transporter, permease protein [Candidatus Saccharibacteria bacterium]
MTFMLNKNIGMALHTMRSSRARSFLTMLGVIIAVAAVTSVVSIGNGIKSAVTEQTNQYSKNVLTIRPAQIGGTESSLATLTEANATASLTTKDVNTISKVPSVVDSVPLTIVAGSAQGDSSFNGVVFAVGGELSTVVNQELAFGAFFSSTDSNNLAVLGATAADKMFDQRVPLGRSFTIRGQQFIVSGVLDKFASTPFTGSTNFNNAIFVPNAAVRSLAPNGAPVYEVLAKVDSDHSLTDADAAVAKALAKKHGGQHDFAVLTPAELAQATTSAFDLLTQLIVAAAIITLLVSGVGIMNVMLVSVTERIHEIGIRKAVGATNRQILNQFITEAAVLCVVGSILGAIFAFFVCLFLRIFTSLAPIYDWRAAGVACLAACGFGILFGALPALKAARKDPIAALRNE